MPPLRLSPARRRSRPILVGVSCLVMLAALGACGKTEVASSNSFTDALNTYTTDLSAMGQINTCADLSVIDSSVAKLVTDQQAMQGAVASLPGNLAQVATQLDAAAQKATASAQKLATDCKAKVATAGNTWQNSYETSKDSINALTDKWNTANGVAVSPSGTAS